MISFSVSHSIRVKFQEVLKSGCDRFLRALFFEKGRRQRVNPTLKEIILLLFALFQEAK